MNYLKKIFTNTRVIIVLIFLLFAIVAIHPNLNPEGVTIRTVAKDSAAANALPNPILNPDPNSKPMNREVIYSINGKEIKNVDEYYSFIDTLQADKMVIIVTNKGRYELRTKPLYETIILNETEIIQETKEVFDEKLNQTTNVTESKVVNKIKQTIIGVEDIGLTVYEAASNNLRKGLELEGGTRVILEPEEEISQADSDMIIENIKQRLNVYGLSDLIVRGVSDFDGHNYILVEIPGANQEEVRELLAKQGKFEAKVGETVVFKGGNDIVHVCRDASCSGIDPYTGCGQIGDGAWVCSFRFSISLSQEAAQAQADATKNLDVIYDTGAKEGYLSENITLYLDDEEFDSLRISEGLRGNTITDISITGSGVGATEQEAALNALDNMKQLQTVLITGSLPVKLNIAQSNAISPSLGEEFIKNALWMGLISILVIVIIITTRYRKPMIAIPIIITIISEIVILLGFAALSGWRLDLASIAGIIIAIGTGVDDQIVIVDEAITQKQENENLSWLKKIKKAFFIIITAYLTTVVAMIPLLGSGAGLLKGFALTTIVGVSIGVFITRPAFAKLMEIIVKEDDLE
jgi:preprotein translocase subunit SecD